MIEAIPTVRKSFFFANKVFVNELGRPVQSIVVPIYLSCVYIQPDFTCSNLAIKTRGQYVKNVNENTRTICEVCSKLTIKTPERSGVFIHNLEQILHIVLVFPLMTLNK